MQFEKPKRPTKPQDLDWWEAFCWDVDKFKAGEPSLWRLLSGFIYALGSGVIFGIGNFCVAIAEQYKVVYNDFMWPRVTGEVDQFVGKLMIEHPDEVCLAIKMNNFRFFQDKVREHGFPRLYLGDLYELVEEKVRTAAVGKNYLFGPGAATGCV